MNWYSRNRFWIEQINGGLWLIWKITIVTLALSILESNKWLFAILGMLWIVLPLIMIWCDRNIHEMEEYKEEEKGSESNLHKDIN